MATIINGTRYVPALNGTLIDYLDCTNDICSLQFGQINYLPSFGGNLAYLIIFAILLIVQIGLGIRFKTWGFLVGMVCGNLLEIIGYVGRLLLNSNDFEFNYFIIYLVCLTIGPAFLSACVYLCLSRLINIWGRSIARFPPKVYTITFITCDLISLVLQAAGGAIASTSDAGSSGVQTGINIMIAGLAFQVASLALFIILALDFAWAVSRAGSSQKNNEYASLRSSLLFKLFPWALALATLTIFIRCCFRVAELQGGFDSHIANDQPLFMGLEGPMIIIAVLALTLLHPGFSLGQTQKWQDNAAPVKMSDIELGTPENLSSYNHSRQDSGRP